MRYSNTVAVRRNNTILFRGAIYPCAIGAGGFVSSGEEKHEGDRKTPVGTFPLRACFFRGDRVEKPKTGLPVYEITPAFGWCDDPQHPEYNRPVVRPFAASHEELYRKDHIYDLLVVIGYNDEPVVPRCGSAIFLHLAREGYPPTRGCVAVTEAHLREILAHLTPASKIKLGA
jgi:L,D-peptidoglycan transpeptidase YkuD (ErfK/YbiS/YcfS/YnhG family)